MGDFFRPWRRKAGCVLLVMALPLMALWVRSDILFDQIFVRGNLLLSNSGCIVWNWQGWGGPDSHITHWYSDTASPFSEDWYIGADGVRLPYWSIIIPLTLLSAVLILWPQRKLSRCDRVVEAGPTEGAG